MNVEEQYVAKRAELWQSLVNRSVADPDFRRALKEDPRTTLESEFGISIPEEANVTVLEETPDRQYIVLPPRLVSPDGALSEEELEAVAGGWHVTLIWTGICFGDGEAPDTSPPNIPM
jgi:hypothetical protein